MTVISFKIKNIKLEEADEGQDKLDKLQWELGQQDWCGFAYLVLKLLASIHNQKENTSTCLRRKTGQ